jgi:hypothetical protein
MRSAFRALIEASEASEMRSKQTAKMLRWVMAAMLCVVAACSGDDRANLLTLTAGSIGKDSGVTHALVTFPGFAQNFVDYGKVGPVTIPVVARSGTIRMQFSRIRGNADTIGRGELSLKITRGNAYSALFTRLSANALFGCFGCNGDLKFPMTGSASASSDSMHIYYSNSLPLCKGCLTQRRDSAVMVARAD